MIDHVSIAVRDSRPSVLRSAARDARHEPNCANGPATASAIGKKYPEFWINLRTDMAPVAADSGAHVCLRAASTEIGRCVSRRGACRRRHLRRRAGLSRAIRRRLLRRLHPRSGRQPHRGGDVRSSRLTITSRSASAAVICLASSGTGVRRLLQHRQNVGDLVGDQQIEAQIAADEFQRLHVLEQRAERLPEALDIGEQHRLACGGRAAPRSIARPAPRACRRRRAARRRRPPSRTSCVCARACRG